MKTYILNVSYIPTLSRWFVIRWGKKVRVSEYISLENLFVISKTQNLQFDLHFTWFGYDVLRDSSAGTALGYGLDDRGSRVRFPARAGNFSLHLRVQNCSGAHPGSYTMGKRGSFPGGKAAGAWSWPLNPSSAEVKEWMEIYLHSPIRLHGVVLS
jgi:hypothetical protein